MRPRRITTRASLRVATTASPVSGMEVRERMLAIMVDTRRSQAASSVQRIWRAVRAYASLLVDVAPTVVGNGEHSEVHGAVARRRGPHEWHERVRADGLHMVDIGA